MPHQAQDKAGTATGTKPSSQTSGDMSKDSKSKAASENPSSGSSKTSSETSPASKSGNTAADSKTANPATDSKTGTSAADSKSGMSPDNKTTTGNAATSATAPPAEKRTQIVSAIRQEKVEEVTNVNFNIAVGTVVPASVHYHSLPSRIVEIYPEWRGYDFIVVHGRYIILRPQTHEIVYIIEG